jgi:IclR family pca regulon transcriptional regulator
MPRQENPVTALVRGLKIMETFGQRGFTLSLAEVAQDLKLPKSTAFRLLNTLVSLGYVVQPLKGGPYSLGPAALRLGYAVLDGLEVREAAMPHLEALFVQVGGHVNLNILDQGRLEIISVARFSQREILSLNLSVGSRLPVYNSTSGRVLTAFLPDQQRHEVLQRLLVDPAAKAWLESRAVKLAEVWDQAREQGYAVVDGEYLPELFAVGAPVVAGDGQVEAAVSVALLRRGQGRQELLDRVLEPLLTCTSRISAVLGRQRVVS